MDKAITLLERRGAIMEKEPLYEILLHGKKVGEIFFNMTGYTGYLPQPNGIKLDIGERPLSVFKKEIAKLNRQFQAHKADSQQ